MYGSRPYLCVFYVLVQVFHSAVGIYFHEPSHIILKPSEINNQTDFGFSIAYQKVDQGRLLIGAPHNDLYGQVYSCNVQDVLTNKTICSSVSMDIEDITIYTRKNSSDQQFCLGASIAATSNYFFTCAPLRTLEVPIKRVKYYGAYGVCYVNNGTAHRYNGIVEQYIRKPFPMSYLIFGGTGWSTLIDESNKLLLVAKSPLGGDITYLHLERPLMQALSISMQSNIAKTYLKQHRNVGYALTSGNFFTNMTTVYAFSMMTEDINGIISFLTYSELRLQIIQDKADKVVQITDDVMGTMFGTSLFGVDLDRDGLSELLVGAPAHGDGHNGYETGALHIYLGGDLKTINDRNRKRTILGYKDGSRFGTTIATSDMDGDGLPEIFISAPYEESGVGAVYVLSGLEINKELLKFEVTKSIELSKLTMTQRIQRAEFRTFGYSLQVVPDLDDNGCDELAVGSPGNASVVLFRCVPTVKVTVSIKLIGVEIVREQDNNFTIEVCVQVTYPLKPDNITTKLVVKNGILGDGAYCTQNYIKIDLSQKKQMFCHNVTIKLRHNEPGYYKFTSVLTIDGDIEKSEDFNSTWVTISPYSKTESMVEVLRRCTGDDCVPKLSMDLNWSGNDTYVLGSTTSEKLIVHVHNAGNSSFESCVWIQIVGAKVAQADCSDVDNGYKCYLPKPLRRNDDHYINILLDMTGKTNQDTYLKITAFLYKNCYQSDATEKILLIPYTLNVADVDIEGLSHTTNVTDKEIADLETITITDEHEYTVLNRGSVLWNKLNAVLVIEKRSFINKFEIKSPDTNDCVEQKADREISFNCTLVLMPKSTINIIAITEIVKDKIMKNLVNDILNITSILSIYLEPSSKTSNIRVITTTMTFQKEMTLAQNKTYIMIIVSNIAIFTLAIVVYGLYKIKFFERKQKTQLDALKQEIRRQSVKRSASMCNEEQPSSEISEQEINDYLDVIEEPALQIVSKTFDNSQEVTADYKELLEE